MIDFRPENGSSLFCRTDYTVHQVANLNFHDTGWTTVPFHVSVRPLEGRVVVNRRDPAGWRREIVLDRDIDPAGGTIEVRFDVGAVSVWLDGQRVARFDRFPRPDRNGRLFLRRGFPGLDRIAHVTVEGAVLPESLRLRRGARAGGPRAQAPSGPGQLALTGRLEIRGRLPAGSWLQLPGDAGDRIDLIPLPEDDGTLGAVLPGRIWQGLPPEAPARLLPVTAQGRPAGAAISLSRADLRAMLTELAADHRLEQDDLAALQAVEHARFSGVLPQLPPRVRTAIWQAAGRFGLTGFLSDGMAGAGPAPARLPLLATPPDLAAEDRLCRRLALALRTDPAADPAALLATVLTDLPAPPGERLFLRLSETFCLHGAFPALWQAAGKAGLSFDSRDWGTDRWTNAALLPFLVMAGRLAEVPKLLWWLAEPRPGWLVTATIAQGVQLALDRPDLPEKLAEDIVYAWIGFLDAQSETYAGRAPCAALRAVSVRLVAGADRGPGWLRTPLRDFALRVHGLDPAFWQALAVAGLPADPLLAEGQAACARLVALARDMPPGPDAQAAIAGALALFAWYRNPETARFRRILLGPAEVPLAPGDAPGLAALRQSGADAGAALLRHLIFPDDRLATPDDPALLRMAAEAVPPAWEGAPEPPHGRLQRDLASRIAGLLAGAAAGLPPDPATLDRLLADLAPLSSARGGWLGLGLGLTLLDALAHGPDSCAAAADRLAEGLVALAAATPAAETRQRDGAPAVTAARRRLAARPGPHPASLARALAALPGAMRSPALPARMAPWPGASPLHDLLVVVMSCQPYLDSRIPTLRSGWLSDLAALGIPHVVVVGGAGPDAAGTRQGDIVFLDAPDDYEGLPQKTLAMIRWVHDHTPFARMMKIDDDCFVDVETLFGSLQHLKFDYLGRPLTRVRGQMDRAWHQAKAASPRGRMDLDKSPEPSSYADGGSGYVLSRRAMATALDQAASPEGRRLIGLSFMEDKMLGDLLTLGGIRVQGQGWRVAVERRAGASGLTVPQWENGPRPFAGSGVGIAHLDTHLTQAEVRTAAALAVPRRGKIWPSFQPLRFGAGSNTLDLVSPQDRLRRVAAAPLAVVACMRNEMFMLPRFLDHYRALGVGGFLIADNGSDDGSLDYLHDQPDVALFSVDTPYGSSMYGVAWQEALLAAFRPGRWTLVADADELLVWDDTAGGDLPALLAGDDFADADAVRLFMLDMYPQGPLSGATFTRGTPFAEAGFTDATPFLTTSSARGPFSDQPTWTSGLRHRLIPGSRPELFVAQKLALLRYRPWMRLTEGVHYVGGARLAAREMLLAHFKYTAAFRAKAEAEVARRQHFNDAEEYRKYLALVSEGRETIHDPALSVAWTDSAFVRHLMATGRAPGPEQR
ncbi:glycosyltransferase family 2 protein [Gemmobacter sp.]|uniref:glycosyltransferase family 2 protein n=1 Tax=Gemmobacter sp. TaxID=1898957 RepID=UPI002AFEB583|nr:glycosyltransferase family 2 protein [Gemmobacter sp.]